MSKVITGRGKIEFSKEKDKDKMEKKYPDVQFEKMNPLTFTTTYKGNEMFDLKIKVGDTEIPCSFKKWAEPWKYGSKLALTPHFKDLGKKANFSVSGGIQGKLFQFFRYDYEKMLGKKGGGGKKRTIHRRHRYISEGTLKSLQKLSYQDLKNLSSEELQKYKRRVGIIQQEHAPEPYTDEELIRMLRKYISGKKGFTTRRDIKRKSRRGGGKKSKKHYGIRGNNVIELYPHRIPRSIGRHKYIISWKTTKENLPNKTFHGKFYKSKEEAMKKIKK